MTLVLTALGAIGALLSFGNALRLFISSPQYEKASDDLRIRDCEVETYRLMGPQPKRQSRGFWDRVEAWGRQNPVKLSLASGSFFLVLAFLPQFLFSH